MRYGTEVAAFLCIFVLSNMRSCLGFAASSVGRRNVFKSPVQLQKVFSKQNPLMNYAPRTVLFASTPERSEGEVKDDGLKGKVAQLWGQYGYIAVGTYITVYISTLGGIFISMDYDIFNAATFGFDPVGAVKKVGSTIVIKFLNAIHYAFYDVSDICNIFSFVI